MIASLSGRIRAISNDRAVVDVNGVGYSVFVTPTTSTSLNIGAEAHLFTTMVVREDSLTLFGFLDEQSRILFELVQTVSGIGPKVAMSILSVLSPADLATAIAQENVVSIERVPGIGRKGAQRLILELKGKLDDLSPAGAKVKHQPPWREDLVSALVGLGYSAKQADGAVSKVASEIAITGSDPASYELSELLRSALQSGGR
ncbi:unannotated protein [freshwater metagenome]|uniref:Unannotated protein n=1 Tax=freshwater metagenome TaxID=449393 RepID=A0A6J6NZ12_9ZZZZ|nr:Holliday junction branch migration protein RuvA [Actinomycetota bacterium]MSV86787.1 Holliday junction branch migration protein RuvA [Actinomycetota bacterium]MSW67509.1 Holliday junction branch migration protein RuvA [Actinomycetota bacterium]MSY03248.1 Holliday junction branch migration protein RuvA [Actinomycetota bacterium]MSY20475.1 Holliday junction branch migration protein RuvA [Actinomycetota bacterium]